MFEAIELDRPDFVSYLINNSYIDLDKLLTFEGLFDIYINVRRIFQETFYVI